MMPDGGIVPVSTSPVLAGTFMPSMLPDTDRTVRLDDSGLEILNSRICECSVLPRGTGDTLSDKDALDGDALGACSRDVGILDGDEEWLCLLYSDSSRSSWDNSVEMGLNCKGYLDGFRHRPRRYWTDRSAAGGCRVSYFAGKRCAECACSGSGCSGTGTEFS